MKVHALTTKEVNGLRWQASNHPEANYEILCLIATLDALQREWNEANQRARTADFARRVRLRAAAMRERHTESL